jgi:hypothetical protein
MMRFFVSIYEQNGLQYFKVGIKVYLSQHKKI